MSNWSLIGEYYSFLILMILFVRYCLYERKMPQNFRRSMFVQCLTMSMTLIGLNVLCVYVLEHPLLVPRWISVALNALYFQWAICVSSQFAYLLFDAILEHVYDKHCLRRATIVLSGILVVSFVLIMVNLLTGMIFYIDLAGIYHRGKWNRLYYGLLMLQLLFVCICYVKHRSSVGDRMRYVMRTMPPLILVICVLQFLYPDVMLNGTIAAIASLLIFIAFRSHTAEQDSLTAMGSREALMDELTLRTDSGQNVQILQINLLNLSEVNVRYSHGIGDALLYEVARYLHRSAPNIQVFRSGGTTFTVMLPLGDEASAERYLQTLLAELQRPWALGEISCQVNAAIAEVRHFDLKGTPSEILEQVEYTMSLAKAKPPLARFDTEVSQKLCRRIYLTELIHRAIEENRFQVVYQPIYCCHRDLFCSAEALLRLKDEDGTPIPPNVFIPLAEESGMILELTWIVLEDICKRLSSGRLPRLDSVAINLSPKQLMDRDLGKRLKQYLQRYGVSPSQLNVEITEESVLQDTEQTRQQMATLEAMGIQIHMDDFGTGYSNLSSVLNFPFSFVKLDRSLIEQVPDSEQAAVMVQALLSLFRSLNKRVIVEGAETREQVEFLSSAGADMIQGYYYAKPVDADRLEDYFGTVE